MTTRSIAAIAAGMPLALLLSAFLQLPSLAEPFKLGVETKGYIQDDPYQGQAQYPAPQMVQPLNGNVQQRPPLQGGAAQIGRPAPLTAGVQRKVALPPAFMGKWRVKGRRVKIEAAPQFRGGASRSFAPQTDNIWTITGDPQRGYAFSNDQGAKSQLFVDKVSGNTAFIRYPHPIKNVIAQEAIVMKLVKGGAQFNGLERISIVKKGEGTRAKVTYQLVGTRQR